MRDLLTKMKPDCFADIIATSALYRPGPLEGGMVMEYVDVKHGRKPPRKVHPVVDEVLAETYGVMVYQEQVMRILNRVGNIELSKSYKCIKAISKKSQEIISSFHEEYIAGAVSNGISEQVAQELWNLIVAFAGYGFNKSHSTAYGLIAYETAYLKAHYPVEFMAALLSCEMESTERISEHVDDARRMKIEVLGPNVNQSDVDFSVLGNKITFGLAALKGVGQNAVQALVDERAARGPFKDIFNLTERVDPKVLTKGTLETLIKAGALDCLPGTRAQQSAIVERAVQSALSRQKDKARGQKSLFGGDDDETDEAGDPMAISLPDVPDWTPSQKLAWEKDTIGFYLTSHPLTQHARRIERYAANHNSELAEMEDGVQVTVGGMISSIKLATAKKSSRNGHNRYANFDLEDSSGIMRCIAWPEDYARYEDLIKTENVIIVAGKVDRRSREPNLIVNRIYTLDQADKEFTAQVAIKFEKGLHSKDDIQRVRNVVSRFPGSTEVILIVDSFAENLRNGASKNGNGHANGNDHGQTSDVLDEDSEGSSVSRLRYILTTGSDCKVNIGPEFLEALAEIVGEDNFDLKAAKTKKPSGQSNGR